MSGLLGSLGFNRGRCCPKPRPSPAAGPPKSCQFGWFRKLNAASLNCRLCDPSRWTFLIRVRSELKYIGPWMSGRLKEPFVPGGGRVKQLPLMKLFAPFLIPGRLNLGSQVSRGSTATLGVPNCSTPSKGTPMTVLVPGSTYSYPPPRLKLALNAATSGPLWIEVMPEISHWFKTPPTNLLP